MRTITLITTILCISFQLRAQMAPDFTVTDILGTEHKLYEDYLDQGKSILIEVFFTTCPPCSTYAPFMEEYYQEWGAGNNDVEFFEMTDKSFDHNSNVMTYVENYNFTFPAISVDGNSLPTVQPYKSGTFGTWFGTPTFIVIAPDGTVQFDIRGSGVQSTLGLIDDALEATGASKPGQTPIAPDFSIEDIQGQTHQLYSDYLNQDKTVVLQVFNTTCSPCNSIASLVQPLNEMWGGGDADVVFFEMSDKASDTDALLFAFQEQYNHTYFGVSDDGGSVNAVAPYKDGTFGVWEGAPTFVVIAPDGTVQYNIKGATNQETIDLLDAAISSTGATQPNPPTMAPDFSVIDIQAAAHNLYADYLNQGKTVMIEVFYTTCPPCNSIAPLLEPLYQEWGAGDYDVEFFTMTDKNSDSDPLVATYHTNHGSTFKAISKDGGSLSAVQPYKNGSFGPWTGTPTFVVIAPDGSVQYDVSGGNNEATIEAIDDALAATGAMKPNQENPVSVLGQVQFFDGNTGVGNAFIQIIDGQGNVVFQDTSASDGGFTLEVLLSQMQPDWEVKAVKNGPATNGVSVQDLIKIQKHLLFVQSMDSPLSRLASDANNSGTISALDMVTITKLLLGITTEFPDGKSWIVLPADTDFGAPGFHPPAINSYSIPLQDIIDGARQPIFTAIKKGDPQGNASPQ